MTVTDQILPDLDRVVAGFVHCLRRGGLPVPIGQSLRFRQALDVLGVGSGIDVYWAGRATLVSRPEEIAMFDAMFLTFFHHNTSGLTIRFDDIVETEALAADEDDGEDGGDGDNGEDEDQPVLRWSAADVLRDKDFADFTPSELDEAHQAMAEIGLPLIIRPSFTLGGIGGGIAYNRSEFEKIVASGIAASPSHRTGRDAVRGRAN